MVELSLLLLLHRERFFFSGLTDARRYFPVAGTIVSFLTLVAMYRVVGRQLSAELDLVAFHTILDANPPSFMATVYNVLLLVGTLPSLVFGLAFLWTWVPQSDLMWVCLLPLDALAVIITDTRDVRLLGGLGIIGGIHEMYQATQLRRFFHHLALCFYHHFRSCHRYH